MRDKFGIKRIWPRLVPLLPGLLLFIFLAVITQNQINDLTHKENALNEVLEHSQDSIGNTILYGGTISRNSSLYSELLDLELPRTIVSGITTRFSRLFNLTGSQPGDSFQVLLSEGDTLLAFEYITSDWRHFKLEREGNTFKEIVQKPNFEKSIRVIEGTVKTTLWEAAVPLLPDESIFSDLIDIFGWEIDFMTETQRGDEFKLILEVYSRNGQFVKAGDILAAEYMLNGISHRAFLFEDSSGHSDYYNEKGYSLRKALLKSPLSYRKISSRFSYARLHPIHKTVRPHLGVDYAAASGTPVVSSGDGVVIFKGWKGGFGKYIEIRHSFGLTTSYGHLSNFAKGLTIGGRVAQGQVIGFVGRTGDATGPHLDYRVKRNGVYIDPLRMTLPAALPVREEFRPEFGEYVSEYMLYLADPVSEPIFAQLSH